MFKSILYSIRYILLIILFYYILQLKMIYSLNLLMIAIIPVNFLAIHYGILYQIKKDNYVTKNYILMSLLIFTSLFNVIFLSLNKVNMIVIVFTIFVNALELMYLDLPSNNKIRINKKNINNKPKDKNDREVTVIEFDKKKKNKKDYNTFKVHTK